MPILQDKWLTARDGGDKSYNKKGHTIGTECINKAKNEEEVADGAENAIQVDIEDILKELSLPNVVPILEQHRWQQNEKYQPSNGFIEFIAIVDIGEKEQQQPEQSA